MTAKFGFKLTITMIVFALAIAFMIAVTDHFHLKEQAVSNEQTQVLHNELMVKNAIETVEKAYYVFGDSISAQMKEKTEYLQDLYKVNPAFSEWNFPALKQILSFEIYILNSDNKIVYTSFEPDLGLDFSACCKKLTKVLDERRASGEFYADGIDIEQASGMPKKYSYMATPDKKYIIQLGYSLQDSVVFNQFNFMDTIDALVRQNRSLYAINVLNSGGKFFGRPAVESISEERKAIFTETLTTGRTTEQRGSWNGKEATYRYVQYSSAYDTGTTQRKVLEIVYNDRDLQLILRQNTELLILKLAVILLVTVVLALIISRWVARPMYLAFHDSLTGLNNRAAFDELLVRAMKENKSTIALLMLDLDNFKLVNDLMGHDQGDQLLKRVAQGITAAARNNDICIRLGGDEFVIIMPGAGREEAEDAAKRVLGAIDASIARQIGLPDCNVTVSIGIALYPEHGLDPETLSKRADMALYASKEKGKNQYQFYA